MLARRLVVLTALALAFACVVDGAAASPATPHAAAATAKAKKKRCALKRKAKCRKAVISGKKVGKVNLTGANLRGATISNTKFSGTNLTHASFRGATLRDVTFKDAVLSSATFKGANLDGVRFEGVDFTGGRSRQCTIIASTSSVLGADGCDKSWSYFRNTRISDTAFVRSDLTRSDFTNARIRNVLFFDSVLDSALFYESEWSRGSIITGPEVAGSGKRAKARYAVFDLSDGVSITSRVDISFSSFLGATDAALGPRGANRAGIRGPEGALGSLSIDMLDDTGVVRDGWVELSEESREDAAVRWSRKDCSTSAARRCGTFLPVAVGGLGRIEIDAPTALKAVGTGVTCGSPSRGVGGLWSTVCHVAIGSDTTVAITAATTAVRTVVISRPTLGSSAVAVWLSALGAGTGSAVLTETCAEGDAGDCAISVPRGTRVVMEARTTMVAWMTVDCPGGAVDAWSVERNERYTCPAVAVNDDLTGFAEAS